MDLSDTIIVAAIGATATTVTSIVGLFISLNNGRKVDATQRKVEAVDSKATEIHTLTNSNLSRVTSQLEVANEKLSGFAKAQDESIKKVVGLERLVADFMARGNIQAVADADRSKMQRASDTLVDKAATLAPAVAPIVAAVETLDTKVDRVEKKVDVVDGKVSSKPKS